jgi:hypothetical protein
LLIEEALVVLPPECSGAPMPRDLCGSMDAEVWANYQFYLKQPKDIEEKMKGFFVDLDCALANEIRSILIPIAD